MPPTTAIHSIDLIKTVVSFQVLVLFVNTFTVRVERKYFELITVNN